MTTMTGKGWVGVYRVRVGGLLATDNEATWSQVSGERMAREDLVPTIINT